MRRSLLIAVGAITVLLTPTFGQDRVITRWLFHGPIPVDTGLTALVMDHIGGESTVLPSNEDGWQEAVTDSIGRLDFNAAFAEPADWHVAYVHTYVSTPEDRTALLVVDSDDDIVAFVNGQRVWLNNVARGLGVGRDTIVVRMAGGWNSMLLKVRNRTGGFEVRGRLATGDGRDLSSLRFQTNRPDGFLEHNHPSPMIALGPLELSDSPIWRDGVLFMRGRAPVTAWGSEPLLGVSARLNQNNAPALAETFENLSPGETAYIDFELPFSSLRDAGTGIAPISATLHWDGESTDTRAYVDPEAILRLWGARINIAWAPIDTSHGTPALIQGSVRVPPSYDGLTVDLLPLGMGPTAEYRINGGAVEWQDGFVQLCAPCQAGVSLAIEITPDAGQPLWYPPKARVREPGYAEYAAGFDFAVALAGREPQIARPDPDVWLSALGDGGDYRHLLNDYATAYAPLAATIQNDTLHLVGNSHIDAAWLWPWSETIDVIRNTWRTSLKLAEIFPGYSFSASSAAFYYAMDALEPGLSDSLRAAAAAGKWIPVGGWWVEPDFNMSSGESLARQGLYGQRYFEQHYGARSRVAWTPDAFGYAWTVPQIFRQSGFDRFVTQKIRWNDSTEFPHNAFIWEGNDGTQIFSYNPYGYSHNLDPALLVPQRIEDRERVGGNHQMVLYGVGDHGGGPTIAMLQRAEDLRRVPTFPTMKYTDPASALDAVSATRPDGAFPVWRDELYLEYHRGTFTSQANAKRRNRVSESMLHSAEALATIDTAAYPRTGLETAWHRVLFNQFHDILPGSSIHQVYEDADRDYDTAWAVLRSIADRALSNIGARMDTRGDGQPVVVFNSLGWTRSGAVSVANVNGDSVRLTVDSVPAYGARVVWLPEDTMSTSESAYDVPTAGSNWIENEFLRVEIDTTNGTITRVYDKDYGRDVLAPGSYGNVLQIFDDQPAHYDAWNIVVTGDSWDVETVVRHSSSANIRRAEFFVERTWGNSTFRQTLVLWRDARYLDFENDFDWHERRKMLKVAFGLNVTADSATYEIPYGTIGRTGNPRTQAERAKYEVPGQRWADVSQLDYGVSILNDSKYGWDYRGNDLRLTLLKAPIWPDSLADRGNHRFGFAVFPHTYDWRGGETMRRAAEYNTPMLAAFEPPHTGSLGPEFSFASTASKNVEIAWLKRAEDSAALVLRLVEWFGIGDDVVVNLSCRIESAQRANLLEDLGEPVHPVGNSFRLNMRPFEIATVVVECR